MNISSTMKVQRSLHLKSSHFPLTSMEFSPDAATSSATEGAPTAIGCGWPAAAVPWVWFNVLLARFCLGLAFGSDLRLHHRAMFATCIGSNEPGYLATKVQATNDDSAGSFVTSLTAIRALRHLGRLLPGYRPRIAQQRAFLESGAARNDSRWFCGVGARGATIPNTV